MRFGKTFHIKIVPEDMTESFSFRITMRWLLISAGIISVVIILFISLIVNSAMDEIKLVKLEYLEKQNDELMEKNKKVEALKEELGKMDRMVKGIQQMLGEKITVSKEGEIFSEEGGEKTGEFTTMIPEGGIFDELKDFVNKYRGFMMLAPRGNPVGGGWVSRGFSEVISAEVRHTGIDIAVPEGTEVRSTMSGRVIFAGMDETYGKMVVIVNGISGYTTIYGHNSELKVKTGSSVKAGDVIAISGNTGKSMAPHLHYEIRYFGVPIDPKDFLEL
ncbi:MAG: peptidoglycan DD-metalloendopeptidase family protein [bacterium]